MDSLNIKGRIHKNYKIGQGGLTITAFANSKLPNERHIPFEDIKSDRFYHVQKTYQYLILAGFFFIIFIYILAESIKSKSINYPGIFGWALPGALSVALFFLIQPKVFFLKTISGKYIKFRVSNNEFEIDSFIKNVIKKRNEYIKFKYGTPTVNIGYDQQYSNFSIMVREQIITTEEYKEKIDQLNKLFNQNTPQKTFFGYSQN